MTAFVKLGSDKYERLSNNDQLKRKHIQLNSNHGSDQHKTDYVQF